MVKTSVLVNSLKSVGSFSTVSILESSQKMEKKMNDNPVLIDTVDGVMTITLNRPEVKNAANRPLAENMVVALEQLENDPDLRVAIITGAGDSFCTGMDLKAFVSGETPLIYGLGFAVVTQNPIKKPLMGSVPVGGRNDTLRVNAPSSPPFQFD